MLLFIKQILFSAEHRQLHLLKTNIKILKWLLNYFDYNADILINKNECFIGDDGVFLNAKVSNRYLKKRSGVYNNSKKINQGFKLYEVVKRILNKVDVIVDLGAHVGEISLYFSKMYPNSRIFSIEPTRKNLLLLKENIQSQFFECNNITIIEKVVCNYNGKIEITSSYGAENTIMLDPKINLQMTHHNKKTEKITEEVDAITLQNFCEQNKIDEIDFIKIDIEGSEPLLTEGINKLKPKLIYIEISDKNIEVSYQEMFDMLKDTYKIYDMNLKVIDDIKFFISDLFSKKVSIYNVSVTDVWLIRKDINKLESFT